MDKVIVLLCPVEVPPADPIRRVAVTFPTQSLRKGTTQPSSGPQWRLVAPVDRCLACGLSVGWISDRSSHAKEFQV